MSLLDTMARFEEVMLVPDPRSIKVASGNSLADYLQMELWFKKKVPTVITSKPRDSQQSLQVQFADMLSGLVQMKFEDSAVTLFEGLSPFVKTTTLFCT